MKQTIMNFARGHQGATSIEYALIAALISIGLILIIQGIGLTLSSYFSEVSGALK
jgi:pilus assembly protein Flp/PilA